MPRPDRCPRRGKWGRAAGAGAHPPRVTLAPWSGRTGRWRWTRPTGAAGWAARFKFANPRKTVAGQESLMPRGDGHRLLLSCSSSHRCSRVQGRRPGKVVLSTRGREAGELAGSGSSFAGVTSELGNPKNRVARSGEARSPRGGSLVPSLTGCQPEILPTESALQGGHPRVVWDVNAPRKIKNQSPDCKTGPYFHTHPKQRVSAVNRHFPRIRLPRPFTFCSPFPPGPPKARTFGGPRTPGRARAARSLARSSGAWPAAGVVRLRCEFAPPRPARARPSGFELTARRSHLAPNSAQGTASAQRTFQALAVLARKCLPPSLGSPRFTS